MTPVVIGLLFVAAPAVAGAFVGIRAAQSSGDAAGVGTSSGDVSAPEPVDPDPLTPPNWSLGTHKSGDPWGSFRAVDLGDWKAGTTLVTAGRILLGILTLGISEGIAAASGGGGTSVPSPRLFVDPEWAPAQSYARIGETVDSGPYGYAHFNGQRGFYKGVRGVYHGGTVNAARGRELYGSDLANAAKRGAYYQNSNGVPVLSYHPGGWT